MAMQLVIAHTIPDSTIEKLLGPKLRFISDFINSLLRMDSYRVGRNSFCVADGTTPDLKNDKEIIYVLKRIKSSLENSDFKTLISLSLELFYNYPKVSAVRKASDICCDIFVNMADNNQNNSIDKIAESINNSINKLNSGRKANYLGQDYYGCAAAGGIFQGDSLHAFGLSDSKVLVFDEDGNCMFETADDYTSFLSKRIMAVKNHLLQFGDKEIINAINNGEDIWHFSEARYVTRKYYRNNEFEPLSYGTFTGEESSLSFVRTGAISLKHVAYVIGTTDGCLNQVKDERFIKELNKHIDTPKKIMPLLSESGSEGSVVIYKKKRT